MTQAILDTVATPSMDQKAYSVSFKGLIQHFSDVLFGKSQATNAVTNDTSALSEHLRKDLGLY
ncbi:hypothetical protein HC723_12245 [Vibrio sp. S11_S32]|uniref:hypothetical protein n=1 Tax=Vibrio sp. S11_S32 TaxID=2720225 RepID=UPI001681004F|nr:hypothetical protein [Vibrio sp. S11_S32]MBD1577201.1 hypothetical protein [Vibrio sp. S11_S32]